ncbi:retropepsin-like protein [Cucumis melo var. makuwa]|uniref:Retropepsin-like protein n=1 Tax=Cucumis melo var. makuwa TaxID=1194695 RepID=A0A5D3DF37_CUCMM|nr:retropepsin-like protein [Cucumis melo var. makuwa]TYK22000.1 retropepsin-like protein [Cucumis melo var. makuwa]
MFLKRKGRANFLPNPTMQINIVDNPPRPFPSRLSQPRKAFANDEELLEVFKKVEVNQSLLTTVKSIPMYASFLLSYVLTRGVLAKKK